MVVICRHVGTDSRVCEVRNSRVKSSGAAVYVLGALRLRAAPALPDLPVIWLLNDIWTQWSVLGLED